MQALHEQRVCISSHILCFFLLVFHFCLRNMSTTVLPLNVSKAKEFELVFKKAKQFVGTYIVKQPN